MPAETIGSLMVRIGADLSDFEKSMNEFQKTFGKLGNKVAAAGQQIGTAFGAASAAIAVGLGLAVNKAMDFDAQMSKVGAIAGASTAELQAMRDAALDLGASTSLSASEVAAAMQEMAAKGYDANQVISAMPGVIAAAEASGEDLAMVADTVSSALNAFGLEASEAGRVADVMAKSANTSAAGITDLQYAFKYAAPIANTLGISMEQLAAATGMMADKGMKGEQAGTTLRMALARLTDPPKEAAAQLRELGVTVTDATGKFLPFDNIIGQFTKATANMANGQKTAALATIFGTEAMTGMLTVVESGPEKFNALTKGLMDSSGASAIAAAQMKDNLAGSMQQLSGAVETLQISIGSALSPAIRMAADALAGLIGWFNDLSPKTQEFIAISAAVAAGLTGLVAVIALVTAGLGALAAAEWAVILPIAGFVAGITAIVAALGALGFGLVKAYKQSETFRDVVNGVWQSIQAGLQALWSFVQPVVQAIVDFAIEQFEELKSFWMEVWPSLQKAFENIWKGIMAFFKPIINTIVELMKWAWPLVKLIITETWNSIKGVISGALNMIMGFIKTFAALFTGDWNGLWEGIKQIFSGAIELIWNWIQLWGTGKILKYVGSFAGKMLKSFTDMWSKIKYEFDFKMLQISDAISTRFNAIVNFIKGLGNTFYEAGRGLIDMMRQGIERAASAVMDSVRSIAASVRNMLPFSPAKEGPLSDLDKLDFAGPITDSIWSGLPAVRASMDHLLTMPSIQPLGSAGAAAGGAASATNTGGMTLILELDGRQIAKTTTQYMGGVFRGRGVVQ